MDKKKLEKYRALLEESRKELMGASVNDEEPDQESHGRDQADLATVAEMRETMLALSKAEREQIREIDEAMARIEAGTYGTCVECNTPIPEKRLKALPHATLCIECKSKLETMDSSYSYSSSSSETTLLGGGDLSDDMDN